MDKKFFLYKHFGPSLYNNLGIYWRKHLIFDLTKFYKLYLNTMP